MQLIWFFGIIIEINLIGKEKENKMKQINQQKIKVLHIDEDRELARNTANILCDNYENEILEVPEDALEKVESYMPDVIFLDLEFQDMRSGRYFKGGLSFLSILKSKTMTKDIPVVIIASDSDKEITKLCMKEGASGLIAKPLKNKDVYRLMKEIQLRGGK